MNKILLLSFSFFSIRVYGNEMYPLQRIVAIQQANYLIQQKIIEDLREEVTQLKSELSAIKGSQARDVAKVNSRIDNVLNRVERFGQITFVNDSRIIQDQGLSIFVVNERTGVPAPHYYHFGTAIEAWVSPYNGTNKLIWSW